MWTTAILNNTDGLTFAIELLRELCEEKRVDPPFVEKIKTEALPLLETLRGEGPLCKDDALSIIRERIYKEVHREKLLSEIKRLLELHNDELFPWLMLGNLAPNEILANEDLMEAIYIRLCVYMDADTQEPVDGNIAKEAIETVIAEYIAESN